MAKKKNKKKVIIIICVLALVFIGVLAVVFVTKGDKAIKVTTSKAERRTITQTVSAVGKIQPETEVKIASETSGEIIYLGVKEGDTVRYDKLLVRIKPDIIETQLEQFKASAEASKTDIDARKTELDRSSIDLRRISDLYKKEYVSSQDYDKAKATYEQAQSGHEAAIKRYEQARAALKQIEVSAMRTTINAPINGIVTSLSVEKGEKVVGVAQMAGTEMMRISDLNIMNAVVDVDENDIILVKIGDTATVEIDAIPDKIYKGIVIEMGHSAKESQLGSQDQVINFSVKIRLIDKEVRLRPGMSCNVEIQTETRSNVVAVPLQSVTVRTEKFNKTPDVREQNIKAESDEDKKVKQERPPSVVFIKKGNRAKMIKVKTGVSDKGFIEITDGLKGDEEIISGSFQAISKELSDSCIIKIDTGRVRSGKFEKK